MQSTNSYWITMSLRMAVIISTVRQSPCPKRIFNAVKLSKPHDEIKAEATKCGKGFGAGDMISNLSSAIPSWVSQVHSAPWITLFLALRDPCVGTTSTGLMPSGFYWGWPPEELGGREQRQAGQFSSSWLRTCCILLPEVPRGCSHNGPQDSSLFPSSF